jgi:hypothetical protein
MGLFLNSIKNKKMTDITVKQFHGMTDAQMILHLRQYSYKSQYQNPEAYEHAEYRVALMQGARYMQTGNVAAFTTSPA